MHSGTDCFHSNQPSLSILSSRRNVSATKHGDLTDKTPFFPTRATFFPYPLRPPTQNTFPSLWNEKSGGSERGDRNEERIRSFGGSVPFGPTRVLSILLRIRILGFVPE
ncbi:hypothetical protein AVEN_99790-1 [Araneus ventricosus]|uniref:Uncharacterized protein n=1 Tax=Araneus ventricosus TaxID=182803 RepID=A0A4Y2KX48_ARAVE|nr:hypothetical protein AVEN_99790-1 [Araneus ventricosus]